MVCRSPLPSCNRDDATFYSIGLGCVLSGRAGGVGLPGAPAGRSCPRKGGARPQRSRSSDRAVLRKYLGWLRLWCAAPRMVAWRGAARQNVEA